MTEDEMVGWCHQFKGQKFEQTPGDSEGQGNPVCCSPWDQSQTQLSDKTTTVDFICLFTLVHPKDKINFSS